MEALKQANLAPIMRFRVPACEALLLQGLAPRLSDCNKTRTLVARAVEEAGREAEIVASWEQVLPFLRLALLEHEEAVTLGVCPGLKWRSLGATPPPSGHKLLLPRLAAALQRKNEFSPQVEG